MTDGKTQLSVQHAQQRVTSSFDHLQCSDGSYWFVSDERLWDFLASRYREYLWFVVNWFMKQQNQTLKLSAVHFQLASNHNLHRDSFQFSSQDSPCSSWTFSALRTRRSTIFAIEIASISGRKHLSDDKPNALWSNRVLNYRVRFSLYSSSRARRDFSKTTSAELSRQLSRHFPSPDKRGFPDNVDTFSTGWG